MYWRNGDERSSISATVRLMLSLINQGQKGVMCHRYNGMGRGHFKFPLMVPLFISTLLLIHRYSHEHTADLKRNLELLFRLMIENLTSHCAALSTIMNIP